jgi:hypothetical protein
MRPQRSTGTVTRRSGPRRSVVVAGITAVVFAVGVAALRLDRTTAADDPALSTRTDHPGTTVPETAGEVPDRAAGVVAAVAYVVDSQRWLYLADDQITAAVTALAAPEAADRLAGQVVAEMREARSRLTVSPGPVWWLVRPLAVRIDHTSPTAMGVSVWTVSVLSAEAVAAPQSSWSTVTVDLDWHNDGGWRVVAVRDRPGPTPAVGPKDPAWNAAPFADALEGFARLDRVAG